MVLPIYSDLFTYFYCLWAKNWGTIPAVMTQHTGGTSIFLERLLGILFPCSLPIFLSASQHYSLLIFFSFPAKEAGKENVFITTPFLHQV